MILKGRNKCYTETGEATPELIWDNWWWRKQPEHVGRNLTEVNITTPHHIKAVLPHAKLIAIFRNPVDRFDISFKRECELFCLQTLMDCSRV